MRLQPHKRVGEALDVHSGDAGQSFCPLTRDPTALAIKTSRHGGALPKTDFTIHKHTGLTHRAVLDTR